jgi:hypothetical protein
MGCVDGDSGLADGPGERPKSLERRITQWRDFGGAVTRTGELVRKPAELEEAELTIGLCERFHSLPEAGGVLDQPADLLRMIRIVDLARPEEVGDQYAE